MIVARYSLVAWLALLLALLQGIAPLHAHARTAQVDGLLQETCSASRTQLPATSGEDTGPVSGTSILFCDGCLFCGTAGATAPAMHPASFGVPQANSFEKAPASPERRSVAFVVPAATGPPAAR